MVILGENGVILGTNEVLCGRTTQFKLIPQEFGDIKLSLKVHVWGFGPI